MFGSAFRITILTPLHAIKRSLKILARAHCTMPVSPPDSLKTRSPSPSTTEHAYSKSSDAEIPLQHLDRLPVRPRHLRTTPSSMHKYLHAFWTLAFLPIVSFAYLIFCFNATFNIVPVVGYESDENALVHQREFVPPLEQISAEAILSGKVKATLTTISILTISISLLPFYTVLSELKVSLAFKNLLLDSECMHFRAKSFSGDFRYLGVEFLSRKLIKYQHLHTD